MAEIIKQLKDHWSHYSLQWYSIKQGKHYKAKQVNEGHRYLPYQKGETGDKEYQSEIKKAPQRH